MKINKYSIRGDSGLGGGLDHKISDLSVTGFDVQSSMHKTGK